MPYPVAAWRDDDGHSIELDPRKIGVERIPRSVDLSMREMFRGVFMSTRKKTGAPSVGKPQKEHLQRCAVQVRYTKGGSVGKWFSHGSYIAREAATKENGQGLGFDAERTDVPVADTLAGWRREKDSLFFRVIISPEFGERIDLQQHARETIEQVERDLGTKLQWVAVSHYNTDNPHVHVVLRGKRDDATDLRISPEYIKEGLRRRAEEAATNQLGYRTQDDIQTVQRREVDQPRFTGLDRKIKARAKKLDDILVVEANARDPKLQDWQRSEEFHIECRLRTLEQMNMASQADSGVWQIEPEFEKSLRTAQKTRDRIKMMEAHGVMASDPNLPFRMLRPRDLQEVEGKILVHAQDEYSGNNFSIVESVTGELVRVPQVKEIAQARQHGNLQAGSYMRLKRLPVDKAGFDVSDLGDADLLLSNERFLQENAGRLAAIVPQNYSGWLGRLHNATSGLSGNQTQKEKRRL